jgi:hypothetical protein
MELSEYKENMEPADYFAVMRIGEKFYSWYPPGGRARVAVPPLLVYRNFLPADAVPGTRFQGVVASLITAATAVVLYRISLFWLSPGLSFLLILIYATCTSAWSTSSRALWQHGPYMLGLSASMLFCLLARTKPERIRYVGATIAFAYLCRPTAAIGVLLFTAYVFWYYRRQFFGYLCYAAPIAAWFCLYNKQVFGSILPPYYLSNSFFFDTFGTAMYGLLFSPSRGLFIFSPVLVFAIYGAVRRWRVGEWQALDSLLALYVVLHWLVISSAAMWHGGASYGPRFFADVIPIFIYFMIPCGSDHFFE